MKNVQFSLKLTNYLECSQISIMKPNPSWYQYSGRSRTRPIRYYDPRHLRMYQMWCRKGPLTTNQKAMNHNIRCFFLCTASGVYAIILRSNQSVIFTNAL